MVVHEPSGRGPRRGRDDRAARAYWPLSFSLLFLVVVGSAALAPLLRETDWWWAMAAVAALVLFSAAVLRRVGVSRTIAPVGAIGVLVVVLTALFGRGTGIAWLLPTPETVAVFQVLAESGAESIREQSTPARAVVGIVFLLAAGAGLIAVTVDILAIGLRWPALAGLPILVPVGVPGVLLDGGTESGTLVLCAIGFLVLLHVDARIRRAEEARGTPDVDSLRIHAVSPRKEHRPVWGTVVVGGIGIVSALVLSAATPVVSDAGAGGAGPRGLLFGSGVSPMVDLGQDLRRPRAGSALHYSTTADTQPYFKLLTMDRFVGTTWTSSGGRLDRDNSVQDIDRPPGLSSAVEAVETRTSVVIDGVVTTWLPAPSPATRVIGLGGSWHWDTRTRAIGSVDTTTRGQDYVVTALELKPTAEQLRASSTAYPESVAEYLGLPSPRPAIIGETARVVTAGTNAPYDAAVALQEYLRGDDFAYDTEAPVEDGYDGGGLDVVATFLDLKRGYCIHFASAMAVMARDLGIPARLALGYLPGSRVADAPDGTPQYNIDSHDLHSWPELYFVGIGWVPFEPTPGRGSVPDYARPAGGSEATPSAGAATPTSAPVPDGALTPDGQTGSSASAADPASDAVIRAAQVVLAALCLVLVPAAFRGFRRRGRIGRIRAGRDGPAGAWTELTDTAMDHGVAVSAMQTPRELAGRLADHHGVRGDPDARAALDRLLTAVERHRYGRPAVDLEGRSSTPLADDLVQVVGAVHAGSDARTRRRALLLPASLWPSVLGRPNRGGAVNA